MKHFIKLKKLSRKKSNRSSLFKNLCNSLIKYEIIITSLRKAKELRIFLEPLITISKFFSNHNFKYIIRKINNIDSVLKLFKILAPRYKNRYGGYLRIYKNGFRKGDKAVLGLICFS